MKKIIGFFTLIISLHSNLWASQPIQHRELGGLHYFLQPITPENKEIWAEFAKLVKKADAPHNLGGALQGFEPGIGMQESMPPATAHNYVAYATKKNKPLLTLEDIKNNALILVTVTNLGAANGHYGIFKNPFIPQEEFKPYGPLSLKLHGFGAIAMHALYPNVPFVVVPPILKMGEILTNSALVANQDYQIFYQEFFHTITDQKFLAAAHKLKSCDSSTIEWLCCDQKTPCIEELDPYMYRIPQGNTYEKVFFAQNNANIRYTKANFLQAERYPSGLYIIKLDSLMKLFK